MADGTKIEWTDATWNPITGCAVVSPGCTNCYAMKLAGTRLRNHPSREGLTRDTKAGPVWTGEVRFNPQWLDEPLRWKKPRMIFVCAHGDLFAEGVPYEWIDQVFAVMALAPQHTFQVLTKRPERMRQYLLDGDLLDRLMSAACRIHSAEGADWAADIHCGHSRGLPLHNVWLGISAEDQRRADERVPDLLNTPAAVHWISAEPLIGQLDLSRWMMPVPNRIRWVVAGGESGPGARPMHPDWPRALRDQCADADVPFLFKQWGNWKPISEMPDAQINDCYRSNRAARAGEEQAVIDEMYGRTCTVEQTVLHIDGSRHGHLSRLAFTSPRAMTMYSITKKSAGRLLDGVEHNGFPEIRR